MKITFWSASIKTHFQHSSLVENQSGNTRTFFSYFMRQSTDESHEFTALCARSAAQQRDVANVWPQALNRCDFSALNGTIRSPVTHIAEVEKWSQMLLSSAYFHLFHSFFVDNWKVEEKCGGYSRFSCPQLPLTIQKPISLPNVAKDPKIIQNTISIQSAAADWNF